MNTPDMSADCPANPAAGAAKSAARRTAQVFTAAVFTAALLLAPGVAQKAEAQNIGDPVIVSNLGRTAAGTGAAPVGTSSGTERRISTGLIIGGTTADYFAISDVTVIINSLMGSPAALGVSIHAARTIPNRFDGDAHAPMGAALITFPPSVVSSGQQVFTAPPGSVLQGGTTYAVVVSAPGSTGRETNYQVRVHPENGVDGGGSSGWRIADARVDSSDGGATWPSSGHGRSALAFRIRGTVSPPPLGLSAPADQNYFAGTAITPLILPAATSGTSPYAYTLTPALPDGLSFNANTRVLSGTPTAFMAATNYTYGVSDSTGATATANFRIAVDACAADLGTVNAGIHNRAFATHNDCPDSAEPRISRDNRAIFVTFTVDLAGEYHFNLHAPGDNRNDAFLVLRAGADNRSGAFLASDDDSGGGPHGVDARITDTITANTAYTLELRRLGGFGQRVGVLQLSITATDCPVINTAVNGPKGIADGATCEITATGSITNSDNTGALRGSARRNGPYNRVDRSTLINRGSITSNSGGKWAVLLNGTDNTFTNYGTVSSAERSSPAVSFGEDLGAGSTRGVLMNEVGGNITATGDHHSPAVYNRGNDHRIENRGTISTNSNFRRQRAALQSHGVEQHGNNNSLINEGAGSIITTGNLAAVNQYGNKVNDNNNDIRGGNNMAVTMRGGNITAMHNDADGIQQHSNNGNITVTGGTVSGGRDGILQSGNNGIITVGDGATVTGGRDGIRVQGNNATITINGTVAGGTGVAIRVGGTGNTLILLQSANLVGTYDLGTPGDNTLLRAPTVQAGIAPQTLNAGESRAVDLSAAFTNGAALTYSSAVSSGDQTVVTVAGDATLTITAVAPGNATVTVTATDSQGLTASLVFAVEVLAVTGQAPPPPPAFQFVGGGTCPQNYFVGETVNCTLPTARYGEGSYVYTLTPAEPAGLTLPAGLTFNGAALPAPTIRGTPTQETAAADYRYTVTDATGESRTLVYRIRVLPPVDETVERVNDVVLPEVTRAIGGEIASAVAGRAAQARRDGAGRLRIGGQAVGLTGDSAGDSAADAAAEWTALAQRLRPAVESGEWKEMLAGSEVVLPVTAGGGGKLHAAGEERRDSLLARTDLTLWLRGSHLSMSGDSDEDADGDAAAKVDWKGTVSGAHLGVDARLGRNFLLGLAGSRLEGDFEYKHSAIDGSRATDEGDYEIAVNAFSPYMAWQAGRVEGWLSVGGGDGDVTVTPRNRVKRVGDVSLENAGFGVAGVLREAGNTTVRVHAEVVDGKMKVKQPGEFAADEAPLEEGTTDTRRSRLKFEFANVRRLAGGVQVRRGFEAGLRRDDGDGMIGNGGEVGLLLGLASQRLASETRLRGLVGHSGGNKEWGVSSSLRYAPGADGQGLSLRLGSRYGAPTSSGVGALWEGGVPGRLSAAEYEVRVDTRLGYGMRVGGSDGVFGGGGLLTPFVETGSGGSDAVRLGVDWGSDLGRESRLGLSVFGERAASGDAVWVKGTVFFGR